MRLLDILTSPWAIMPDKLLEIQAVYFTHLRGDKIDLSVIEAAQGKPLKSERVPYVVDRGVAILDVQGIIAKKMNLFTQISGGVSTQILKADFKAAMTDKDVTAILLNVDSPGGTVDGTEELAAEIQGARGVKPVVAYTDGMIASAAYWIAASAEAIYISGDTPWIGSIGVVTSHVDYSQWEQKAGVKTTEIYAGKYKRIDSEYAPLSQDGRDYLQAQVDYIYSVFAKSVSKNRPGLQIPKDDGPIEWADGKIFIGTQAIDRGLVDGVATMEGLIESLSAGKLADTIRRARVENDVRRIQKAKEGGITI